MNVRARISDFKISDYLPKSFEDLVSTFSHHFGDVLLVLISHWAAIHRINHYPADSVVCFVNTYPLDSDLSEQPGQDG